MTDQSVNKIGIESASSLLARMGRCVGVAGVASMLLLLASCEKKTQAAGGAPPPANVTVAAATAHDVPVYLDEIGRTTAFEVVNVQPQVTGKLAHVLFKDGDDLALNAPLFEIDKSWFNADVAQVKAVVKQRDAEWNLAKQEFKRVEGLKNSKAISEQEFEQRQNAVAVAEAQKVAAEAQLATAELNVQYTDIKSPISGRAGQRKVDVGNIVKANEAILVTIQNLDKLYVDFTTSERNLSSIREHISKSGVQKLKTFVSIPGSPAPAQEGKLTFLDNAVQAASGTIKLRAEFDNKTRQFWPQQFVMVRLVLETKRGAVLVPAESIQVGQAGTFVFVVNDKGAAEMRPIVQGQRQPSETPGEPDRVVILSGVAPGDKVVRTGQQGVMPGAPVKIVPDAPPAGAGAPPANDETHKNAGK